MDRETWTRIPDAEMRHVVLVIPHRLAYCRGVLRGICGYAEFRSDWRFTLLDPERATARKLHRLEPDGIIALIFRTEQVPVLTGLGVPVVDIVDAVPSLDLPLATSDDVLAGRLAGEHLRATGLRSFAYVGYDDYGFSRRRLAGFRRGIGPGLGETCSTHLLPATAEADPSDDLHHRLGDLRRWLKALPRPVGIYCSNDILGLRLSELCRELGLAVPDQVALVGTDDDDLLCRMARPPLSSVGLPAEAIGRAAASMLDRLMAGQRLAERTVLLPPTSVTVRQSSDLLAVDDPELAAALRVIRSGTNRSLRVNDLLRRVPMARRALERRFQRYLGRSPLAEIHRVRLDEARKLLAETTLSVAMIAERTGFAEARLLSAALKKQTGLTASEFRQRVQA